MSQKIPGEIAFEVIVTDDSEDQGAKICINKKYPSVKWLEGPRKGPAANRNQAARIASGDWLVFIDDDTEPHPGFLAAYHQNAITGQYRVLEGKLVCPDKRNSPFYRMPENLVGGLFMSGNLAFERETFFHLGAFDEDLVIMEDLEMANRIRRHGIPHYFCPEAVVDHRAQRIGWKHMLWWSTHHKWSILYDFKTGNRNLPSSPSLSVVPTCARHLVLLLRTTWHLFSQHDPATWKNRWFWQAWGWICLPVSLSALSLAEFQFHRLLKSKQSLNPSTA
jgi:GT2 family glycosyltransferase